MSSILRIASSRANGAKSRGPVTEEGKRASQNATRHGFLADSMVLEGESDDRFSAYLSVLEDELQPAPGVESSLAETMAVAHWRRMRIWSLEKAQYILETGERRATHPESLQNGETPITQLARSFRSLSDESRALELLNRYETRLSREFQRALACLKNHQMDKRKLRQQNAPARAKTVQISKPTEPNLGKIR
jgi:hypothetical protein